MLGVSILALALVSPGASAGATSKKAQYLAAKKTADPARGEAPSAAVAVVYARNLHTHEVMPLEGPRVSAEAVDAFLRCWFTHEHSDIPSVLVDRILETAHRFEARRVHIVSGFRHPKYNKILRKKGRQVAAKSQHTEGHAVDFSLVGVDTNTLYRYLLKEHQGGVGYYPHSAFVHIDTGRKRTWRGS